MQPLPGYRMAGAAGASVASVRLNAQASGPWTGVSPEATVMPLSKCSAPPLASHEGMSAAARRASLVSFSQGFEKAFHRLELPSKRDETT
jgi:hypothetical protein